MKHHVFKPIWIDNFNVKGERYEEQENLKIITVKPQLEYRAGLPPSFGDNIRYVLNAYRKAKSLVKKENIDVIHSNNFSPALAGSLISYFTGVSHINVFFFYKGLCFSVCI